MQYCTLTTLQDPSHSCCKLVLGKVIAKLLGPCSYTSPTTHDWIGKTLAILDFLAGCRLAFQLFVSDKLYSPAYLQSYLGGGGCRAFKAWPSQGTGAHWRRRGHLRWCSSEENTCIQLLLGKSGFLELFPLTPSTAHKAKD